jgi:acetyltransferase-like isoleucine patch superfamily enzyme
MYKTIINIIMLLFHGKRRKKLLAGIFRTLSCFDSKEVWKARIRILKALGAEIGAKVIIKAGVVVDYPEKLIINDNVSIQNRCYLSSAGGITIGSNVSIAHDCSIISSEHQYANQEIIRKAPLSYKPVIIGNNVWLGMKVSVLAGVAIGDNCVVGAASVVTRSLEAGWVYVGTPAKKIKKVLS